MKLIRIVNYDSWLLIGVCKNINTVGVSISKVAIFFSLNIVN